MDSKDSKQETKPVVKGMTEDKGHLGFQFSDIGSGSRNLVLFLHVLNRICFLILGFIHNGLRFLLEANSLVLSPL